MRRNAYHQCAAPNEGVTCELGANGGLHDEPDLRAEREWDHKLRIKDGQNGSVAAGHVGNWARK